MTSYIINLIKLVKYPFQYKYDVLDENDLLLEL